MPKKAKEKLKVEIKRIHGFLNDKKNKVVASISYNDAPAGINIRKCWESDEGELMTGQGIILTEDELDVLTDMLLERRREGSMPVVGTDGRKAVQFKEIFSSASDIVEKRDSGYTTEDGFIRMTWKPGAKQRRRL